MKSTRISLPVFRRVFFKRGGLGLPLACLGLTLNLSGVSATLQAAPKLLDAADTAAVDKEYQEQIPLRNLFDSFFPKGSSDRVAAILKKKNERDLDELISLVNVGGLMMADSAMLRDAFSWIVEVQTRTLGPNDPKTGANAVRLGTMFWTVRDYAQASRYIKAGLPGCEKRLQILASTKQSTGPADDELLIALFYESEMALRADDYSAAEAYTAKVLNIARAQQDTSGESRAESRLGRIQLASGDLANARQHYEKARKLLEENEHASADDREELREGLAMLALDEGRQDEARHEAEVSWQQEEVVRRGIINFPEKIGLLTLFREDPYSLAVAIGATDRLAKIILDWKSNVLESEFAFKQMEAAATARNVVDLLYERRTAQQETGFLDEMPASLRSKLDQDRKNARAQIARSPMNAAQKQAALASLEDPWAKVKRLSDQLTVAGIVDPRISATVETVNRRLGPKQVLVEYVRYYRYLGRAKWERTYGAMVYSHDHAPRWAILGRATALDEQAVALLQNIRDTSAADGASLRTALHAACQSIWDPVAALLPPDADDVIVSPDGTNAFLPFAALLDAQDKFLADKFCFSFVTGGRDLLRPLTKSANSTLAIFGDPNYRLAVATKGRSLPKRPDPVLTEPQKEARAAGGSITLEPLAQSGEECRRLEKLFRWEKLTPDLKLGSDATESALRNLRSPRALHLATHGKYLSRREAGRLTSLVGDDADQRSLIFLAGAQNTLDEHSKDDGALSNDSLMSLISKSLPPSMRGAIPGRTLSSGNTDNDGIVTAEEISSLHLAGTWLVTLSACETGVGQARAGEGVIGLRRSFVEAGAQNLLMSLWSISNEVTPDLMVAFYQRALETHDAPRAWGEVQRVWLDQLSGGDKSPQGTADFKLYYAVQHAGAFVLSRQGVPNDAR